MPSVARQAPTKNPVTEAVGLPDAPVLTTRAARGTGLAFLELNCERRNIGITHPVHEDAFLVALQLKTCPDFDLYADGKPIPPKDFAAGAVAIFDLRMNLATDLRDPFHAVNLYLPHKALVAMGDHGDIPRHIQELRHTPGTTVWDPVARDLLLAMRPALAARPDETPELFVDHLALALSIHVARRYGDVAALPRQWGGGLAPWQERRAKELLDVHMGGGITLDTLARSCGLSVRHFTRAFRQSTGMAPYQWLQYRRMEKAKQLLEESSAPLSTIALDCGFADQSHFTRTFSRVVGVTPGTWRRLQRE
ncbi:helix-turn-helix domain-containing protein [Microvirga mediterraneensis]|uniref:Helix-turn-helix transcriptional regulator n=1 Tax=Microvirga mediterraneensis TaxID=2754695 RepID=A0A838BLX7_9HYPH|nr:AraC family transcriptional regulator [Microvirga mediterraneensis]MBA1155802.1 helix-turn-helix transcriptional regulator [Microvirga mediterraneensis]